MDILLKFCLVLGMCFTGVQGNDVEQREYAVVLPAPVENTAGVLIVHDYDEVIGVSEYPYPAYISVRITGVKQCDDVNGYYSHIEYVPFMDYVKGVLANEWGANWTEEASLRAGAVAVKQYAWNAVVTGGKWGGFQYGNVYDCDWDMVYNPDITRPQHSQAVEDTWDYYMLDADGDVPRWTHFLAWYGACVNWLGDTGTCMGQWNSLEDAKNGMDFKQILEKYYYNNSIVKVGEEIK